MLNTFRITRIAYFLFDEITATFIHALLILTIVQIYKYYFKYTINFRRMIKVTNHIA